MAPEIFAGGGYSYNADFWSLGVCCYEFLYGSLPYGENFDVIMILYNRTLMKYMKISLIEN